MNTLKLSKLMLAGTALVAAVMPLSAPRAADDKDDGSTTVQVSAEARRMVPQDRVQATLAIESTGKAADKVQNEINTKMQAAQKLYSTVDGVKATTGSYNVYKDYEPDPSPKPMSDAEREKLSYWRGSQELNLDGVKKDDLLKLIADLQKQGFAVRNLNFYMSRAAEDGVKDALIVEALKNIQARAENIRQALGMKTIRYARLDLNSGGGYQPRAMMAMAKGASMEAADSVATPVGEAGETEVVMNVTAEVKLK